MKKRNRIPLMILTGLILILAGVVLLRQSVHARMYAHKVVNMLSGIDSSAIAMEGGDQSSFFQRIEQLEEALLLTRKHYYKDVEMDKMLEGAIRGAVASLDDPYSYYQSPVQKQREKEDLFQGQFGGLGIHIWAEDKGGHSVVTISSVLPDKPASHAGLQAGDIIAEIEGESAILGGPNGLSMADILEKLRGRVGEPVTITIHRRNSPKPIKKTLVREVIAPKSIFSQVIEPGVVYVKLETFKRQSVNEFEEALRAAGEETHDQSAHLRSAQQHGRLAGCRQRNCGRFPGGRRHRFDQRQEQPVQQCVESHISNHRSEGCSGGGAGERQERERLRDCGGRLERP